MFEKRLRRHDVGEMQTETHRTGSRGISASELRIRKRNGLQQAQKPQGIAARRRSWATKAAAASRLVNW
jgi:hypothetical protein